MELVEIDIKEMKYVYRKYLKEDFPRVERKPLSVLVSDMKHNKYRCFVLTDNNEICGYAFLVKNADDYLLDYLAVPENSRNKGYGSKLLECLNDRLSCAKSIIAEIESPAHSENTEDEKVRVKRRNFYLRNGFEETGVTVRTFGVYFDLIAVAGKQSLSEESLRALYRKHYETMLSNRIYKKMIDC